MGGTDRYVYAKNVVPWEAQTGMFMLKNVESWEAQTSVFTLRMQCHGKILDPPLGWGARGI